MTPFLDVSAFGLTLLVMLIGLVGLVVPLFPGSLVIWLAAFGYGLAVGFNTLGIVIFVMITLLMLVSLFIDDLMLGAGARKGGASIWTSLLAILAGFIGTLVFPPFGGLIAAPATIFLVTYLQKKDANQAWAALKGAATGWGLAFVVRLILGVGMIGLWALWALVRT